MTIGQLRAVIPPPDAISPGRVTPWSELEIALGTALPPDYQQLVDIYGVGCFGDFLWVFVPQCGNPHLELAEQIRRTIWAQDYLRRNSTEVIPYPIFPEPEGLLPFAVTDNGDELYWVTEGAPAEWWVVANESRSPEWYEFRGDMTTFLAQVFGGHVRIPFLRELFLEPDRRRFSRGWGHFTSSG
jgi:hypothetical protein